MKSGSGPSSKKNCRKGVIMDQTCMVMLAALSVSSASLAAVLALFWNLKKATTALGKRLVQDRKETVSAVELLRSTMKRLETEVAEGRKEIGQLPVLSATQPSRTSINISKRTQALRLHQRGEPLERIAAVLGIPRSELELLVKLQNTARYTAGASA